MRRRHDYDVFFNDLNFSFWFCLLLISFTKCYTFVSFLSNPLQYRYAMRALPAIPPSQYSQEFERQKFLMSEIKPLTLVSGCNLGVLISEHPKNKCLSQTHTFKCGWHIVFLISVCDAGMILIELLDF